MTLTSKARGLNKEAFWGGKSKSVKIHNDGVRDAHKIDFYKHQALEDEAFETFQNTNKDSDYRIYVAHNDNAYHSHMEYMKYSGSKVLSEYHHNL